MASVRPGRGAPQLNPALALVLGEKSVRAKFISGVITFGVALLLVRLPLATRAQVEVETKVRGLYYNYDYAYQVRLPNGLTGFRSPAPMPNHGFVVRLNDSGTAYLWVDASYNAMLWASLREAADANVGYLKHDSLTDPVVLAREPTRLGGLTAHRVVVKYTDVSGTAIIEEKVLVMRKPRDANGIGIMYTIGLRSPQARLEQDRAVFNALYKSFALRRLP